MWIEHTNGDILRILGERLKEYRLRKDIQQTEMAVQAGVNVSTVIRIENGQNVNMDSYIRILRVLGMIENLENFIPEPPRSPILMKQMMGKKKYRIRRLRKE